MSATGGAGGTDTGNNNLDDFLNKICQRQIETTETRVRSSARQGSGAVIQVAFSLLTRHSRQPQV